MWKRMALAFCLVGCQEVNSNLASPDAAVENMSPTATLETRDAKRMSEAEDTAPNETTAEDTATDETKDETTAAKQSESREKAESIIAELAQISTTRVDWYERIAANSQNPTEGSKARGRVLDRKLLALPDIVGSMIEAERALRDLTTATLLEKGGGKAVERISCEILAMATDATSALSQLKLGIGQTTVFGEAACNKEVLHAEEVYRSVVRAGTRDVAGSCEEAQRQW